VGQQTRTIELWGTQTRLHTTRASEGNFVNTVFNVGVGQGRFQNGFVKGGPPLPRRKGDTSTDPGTRRGARERYKCGRVMGFRCQSEREAGGQSGKGFPARRRGKRTGFRRER